MDEAARRQAAVDDFDRKVGLPHGAVDLGSGPDVPTQGIPPEPTEPYPTRIHGSDVIHPEPDRYAKVGEAQEALNPLAEQPVDPEGDASYWRAAAESAADDARRWREQAEKATAAGLALARDEYEPDREGVHPSVYLADDDAAPIQVDWGTPTDVAYRAACEQLAEAAETFLHDMRAAWARLPARSRPYETHAALLEAIAAYHKAKNRSS